MIKPLLISSSFIFVEGCVNLYSNIIYDALAK